MFVQRCSTFTRSVFRRAFSNGNEGAIVSAGGAFAKREHAQEELYFYNLQKQRIEALRALLAKEEQLFKVHYCKEKTYSSLPNDNPGHFRNGDE